MATFIKVFQKNKATIAILVFLILFSIIHLLQPKVLYNENGSFRDFGVGYRNKTVFPIWMVAILLAISSYLCVCWIVNKRLI